MFKKFVSSCLALAMIITGILQFGAVSVSADTGEEAAKIDVVESSASTSYSSGNDAGKAFDGDSGTRWTSNIYLDSTTRNEQYLQAKFENSTAIDRIDITWYTPWVNEYEIRISNDGSSWQTVLVSSVTEKGTENGQEGAEYLQQRVTSDALSGVEAQYIQIAMTDVEESRSYLSVVDMDIYSMANAPETLKIQSVDVGSLGSYGANSADKMIDGTTDTAGNRWTSSNINMTADQISGSAIEFTFEEPAALTRFDVDWFNTPVTSYSIEAAGEDGVYETIVDTKAMPAPDMKTGVDSITHTKDCFAALEAVKSVRLILDTSDDGFLSICEVRAYGIGDEPEDWEINLVPDGAAASASSVQSGGMEAGKAIDGNQGTRWASSFNEQPSWLLIDLGEEVSFDQMKIYQEAAYGKAYNVEVSSDGSDYTKIYETENGTTGENNIYFGDDIHARYVRINFTAYGMYSAYSVWEVELYKNGADRMFEMAQAELSVPNKISADFTLPAAVQNMKVDWSVDSDLLQIDDEGNVTVTNPEADLEVTFTASLTYGGQTKEIEFKSTVLSEDNREVEYEIYPVPQQMTLGEDGNVELDKDINVVLSEELKDNEVLKNRIEEVFTENGYTLTYADEIKEDGTNLLAGVNGDESAADKYADENDISRAVFEDNGEEDRYDRHLVSLDGDKTILVLAESSDAAYYGFATLDLMFETAQSDSYFGGGSTRMTTVLVEDYADMQYRGVIEGFYGWPWSLEDRLSFTEFAKRYKLNYYAYGPKSDPYHLSKWNQEYPTEATITEEERELGVMTQEDFRTLIEACNSSNIDFVWSVHPAMGDNKIDFNSPASIEEGEAKIMDKYESMYDLGVRQFGLFVDDINLTVAYNNREAIADLVDDLQTSLYEKWGRALEDPADESAVRPLMFVPSHYFLSFGDSAQNEAAIRALADVHEDVIITFTGYGCWSNVVEADAETFAERAGRDPMFWWNYSTNDVMDDQLFTDKADSYYSMNKDVTSLYGFISNPMNEAELSKISLFGIADYAWNVADFDSTRDYDAYFEMEFSDAKLAEAYKNVAVNLDKNGKSLSAEKTLMNQMLSDYRTNGSCDAADIAQLRAYAQNLKDSLTTVEQFKDSENTSERNLYDEMHLWLNKLNAMADMTLALCDYLDDPSNQDAWEFYAAHLLQLNAFDTDDAYVFTSLELDVNTAGASYLRNAVAPNDPLCSFLENMNAAMKENLNTSREVRAELITNAEAYKDLTVSDQEGDISLVLNDVALAQNEYAGIAFGRIFNSSLDLSAFSDLGLSVEYSLNGKEWTTDPQNGFAYVRIINHTENEITATGEIAVSSEQPSASAETGMSAYSNNTIANVVDGDKTTKFWKNGNQAQGDSILVTYEKAFYLQNLGFYFDSANGSLTDAPQTASVEVSSDGSAWEKIKDISIDEIQAAGDGLYYVNIENINSDVQYVRYTITEPTGGQWFRMVEIAINEDIELPQSTVNGQTLENVSDGNITTYSALPAGEKLYYQVIENADVNEISVRAMPNPNEETNAKVFIYASETNYPYQNEWIDLGTLTGSLTTFDVSQYYNLQQIAVENAGEDLNVFEVSVSGDAYSDDAELKALVDTAIARLKELRELDTSDNTISSVKLFNEALIEAAEALQSYESAADVQNILTKLEESTALLEEKGNSEELESVYQDASLLNKDYYTEESYAALETALQQAEELLDNVEDADQEEINAMTDTLNKALEGLKYRPADYTAVDDAVAKAEALNKADYKDFSKVEEAVAAVVRDLDIRYQADVNQMAQDILDAISKLEKITVEEEHPSDETPSGSDETPSKPGETPTVSDTPSTGDSANIALWVTVMMIAAILIGLASRNYKRRFFDR